MDSFLVYNFSGELSEVSHLFPNERLAKIAAIVKAEGKEITIIDRANFHDMITLGSDYMENLGKLSFYESNELYKKVVEREAREIAGGGFDCIFMNLWHGAGFKFSVDLLNAIKGLNPAVKIYGIGQKVDWFTEHILRLGHGNWDGLITGLGYNAVENIVAGREFKDSPNVIFSAGAKVVSNPRETISTDSYPGAVYDPQVYSNINHKLPVYSLTLSNQACPNRCVFCVRPGNYGREVENRDISVVLDELKDLRFNQGVRHFRIEDSTPPKNSLTELAEAIVSSGLQQDISLSAFSRVDMNSAEDFPLLREAGFVSLFFGLESLDDDNLKRLRKGFTFKTVGATLEKAHSVGIKTVGSFMFPTPGETRESMENTLQRIALLRPVLDSVLVLPAAVPPSTEWGKRPADFGIRFSKNYIEESIIYPVKYELPIEHWRPFPFTYDLEGVPAEKVTFADIARLNTEFTSRIRNEIGIPRIPDYYFLLADFVREDPEKTWKTIVGCLMKRDYERLRDFFGKIYLRQNDQGRTII